jgi:hypothetical protein
LNYRVPGLDEVTYETGVSQLAGVEASFKYKYVYIADRIQEYTAMIPIKEFGCGYG